MASPTRHAPLGRRRCRARPARTASPAPYAVEALVSSGSSRTKASAIGIAVRKTLIAEPENELRQP